MNKYAPLSEIIEGFQDPTFEILAGTAQRPEQVRSNSNGYQQVSTFHYLDNGNTVIVDETEIDIGGSEGTILETRACLYAGHRNLLEARHSITLAPDHTITMWAGFTGMWWLEDTRHEGEGTWHNRGEEPRLIIERSSLKRYRPANNVPRSVVQGSEYLRREAEGELYEHRAQVEKLLGAYLGKELDQAPQPTPE